MLVCLEKCAKCLTCLFLFVFQASNVQFEPSHNIYILEFMKRLPIQKALTNQLKVFKSHFAHFWKNAKYDEVNDVINSSVSINGEVKEIIITEQLVREVLEFPDDENSPTGFLEKNGQMFWVYPRFVQMMLDHAYPNLVKGEQNDLMVLHHMDNEMLIRLSKYTKNWPEPKKTKFSGTSKMISMKILIQKEEKGGKRTPKAQTEEGSSSQPQKKRKKKVVETLLVDAEEDEKEANVDKDQEHLSPETEQLLKSVDDTLEVQKSAGKMVVDDEEEGSSDSEGDIDAQVERWIRENYDPREKEQPKKRKRSSGDDDDETYVPPENVQVVTPPSSRGRKKSTSRKRVITLATRKLKFKLKLSPLPESQTKPPSPPPQNKPPSPPPQNKPPSPPPPPQQPSPDLLQSPQSSPQHHTSLPILNNLK
ncbi:hypothetical protein Hanom_Chr01g00046211 [Helianthus anomalus]